MTSHSRHIGLVGATGIGVGAIVGGGILALAGTAFATTGPAAMLAFALNGVIALLTALSLAEMASKFPESGGTYTFAKKALSVEAAFAVGWVVWFASIVASVLYAIGFAHFAIIMASDLWQAYRGEGAADWLHAGWFKTAAAIATTALLAFSLTRKSSGGGHWVNVAKVAVFALLILSGLVVVARQGTIQTTTSLTPFFTAGIGGLVQAMGYTFIALQGFDLIAAVGGEVRQPAKTIPRAMVLSLLIALAIYLPLLFVITTAGTPPGQTISELARENPEGIVATAAESYLGPTGYWFVIVAAVLSMFSALQANLFAASRIAQAMASDRALPPIMSVISAHRGTPVMAIVVTAALVSVIALVLPDVGAAGAASSLIFLVTFAISHLLTFLIRRRSRRHPPPFRTLWFPMIPVVGGFACMGLAVFQGIVVPAAGLITVSWLAIGGILFLSLFAQRARVMDVSSIAIDPELATLRGRTPLVLVPIANPNNAEAMISLADALVPAEIGRVLTQTIVVPPADWDASTDHSPIQRSQEVMHELLRASNESGIRVEALTTIAAEPMAEIDRVARLHRCDSVLLGLSKISEDGQTAQLESLLGQLDANVVILRSRENWHFKDARRVLVPIAGRGGHEHLLAMLLGSMKRSAPRDITFLRVMPNDTADDSIGRAKRDLRHLAHDLCSQSSVKVVTSNKPLETIAEQASEADVLILGVQRVARREKLFGNFICELANRTDCPIILISSRG
ncbi:amino acid permease [Novipirellula rosea]|uniref:Amino acid permease n=1 Tax=Novipirellula rosea TaxID=1031540 RepID=A0ABP8MGB7_9BACT